MFQILSEKAKVIRRSFDFFQQLSEVMKNLPKLGQQLDLSSSCPGHQKHSIKVNVTKAVPRITHSFPASYSLNRQHGQVDFLVSTYDIVHMILAYIEYYYHHNIEYYFYERQLCAIEKISSFILFALFNRDCKPIDSSTFFL